MNRPRRNRRTITDQAALAAFDAAEATEAMSCMACDDDINPGDLFMFIDDAYGVGTGVMVGCVGCAALQACDPDSWFHE